MGDAGSGPLGARREAGTGPLGVREEDPYLKAHGPPPGRPHPPAGKDAIIVAKVNGKELPGKPTIKWFKGKWQELDSKSGARFSFKESHDAASNVRRVGRGGGGAWRQRAGPAFQGPRYGPEPLEEHCRDGGRAGQEGRGRGGRAGRPCFTKAIFVS